MEDRKSERREREREKKNLAGSSFDNNVTIFANGASLLRIGFGCAGISLRLEVVLFVRHPFSFSFNFNFRFPFVFLGFDSCFSFSYIDTLRHTYNTSEPTTATLDNTHRNFFLFHLFFYFEFNYYQVFLGWVPNQISRRNH